MDDLRQPPRFHNQVIIYAVGQALNYGIGFFLLPLYSRLMPAEQYGILEIINRTIEITAILLLTQFAVAFIRFYRDKPDVEHRRLVTSTCIYLVAGVSLVMGGAMALAREQLSLLLFQSDGYSAYFGLAAIKYVTGMAYIIPLVYFQAREEPGKYIVISAASFGGQLGLNILLLYLKDDKVAAVLMASIIAHSVFLLTVGTWVFLRSARRFSMKIAKQLISFSWSFTFLGVYAFIFTNGDRYFLNEFCGKTATGLYAFGYKLAMVLYAFVYAPIIRAWNAKMVDVMRRPDGEARLARLASYALLLYSFVGLSMAIYSREIIGILMDPRYFDSYRIVPVVLLAYAFAGMAVFFDTSLYISKHTYLKIWNFITTAGCLILYYLLIPRYCGIGAAWATVGTYILVAVAAWIYAQCTLPVSYEFKKMAMILMPAIAMYALNVELEDRFAEEWSLIALLAAKAGLVLFYVGTMFLLRVVEPEDMDRLREMAGELRGRFSSRDRDLPTSPPLD
ncbi:MAG: oligosaccharide flippase family protein [bacterium]